MADYVKDEKEKFLNSEYEMFKDVALTRYEQVDITRFSVVSSRDFRTFLKGKGWLPRDKNQFIAKDEIRKFLTLYLLEHLVITGYENEI